jgi:hypothetical protein
MSLFNTPRVACGDAAPFRQSGRPLPVMFRPKTSKLRRMRRPHLLANLIGLGIAVGLCASPAVFAAASPAPPW